MAEKARADPRSHLKGGYIIKMKKQSTPIPTLPEISAITENPHTLVAVVNARGGLVAWNIAFGDFAKVDPFPSRLDELFHEKDRLQVLGRLSAAVHERWTGELHSGPQDGHPPLFECMLMPLSDGSCLFAAERIEAKPEVQQLIDRLNRQVKMFRLESEAAKKIARNKQIEMESVMVQAREVALVDPLTFLPNRRMIVKELQSEVIRSLRYKTPLSISVLDLDHFKHVNDTYGHPAGDEVLRQVAYQLRDLIRQPDVAGRYGGEEFLILLPSSDLNAAAEQAARICKTISKTPVLIHGTVVNVTVSIGVAQFRVEADTWDTLLNRADTAMYEAKNAGRNRWVVDE